MSIKRISLSVLLILMLSLVFVVVSCKEEPETMHIFQTPSIRGTIDIPAGANVSGSDFRIRVMEGEKAVYTGKVGSDGSFSVSGLSENVSYDILVTTASLGEIATDSRDITVEATSGYGGWLGNVTASLDVSYSVGSVPVSPLGTIKGSVTIEGLGGNEMPMVTVFIPGTSFLSTVADDGTYSITNVPQSTNPYKIRFWSIGYLTQTEEGIILHSSSDTENPVVEIEEVTLVRNTGSIEGFAVRDGEADCSGIILRLEQENSTVNLTSTTSSNGYFRIDDVPPGKYRILASYSGYLSQASGYVDVTAANLTTMTEIIELGQNIGTIKGSVSLEGNTQKGGININIVGIDSDKCYSSLTTDEGSFSRNVASGKYIVTAYYPGFTSNSMEVTITKGSTVQADIPSLVSALGKVSGRVVLDGSIDASGIVVTLTHTQDQNKRYSAYTDSQGTYLISGIDSSGEYLIECSKDGYLKNTSTSVNVSMGVISDGGTIAMKSITSKISGKASLEGTTDYSGIAIMLKNTNDGVQYDATTDQQGNYVMARVNPGEYTLTISKAGFVSKVVDSIIIESSTEKILETVSLVVGVRSVTGSITAELKSDYSGFLVTATNLSDEEKVYSAITNTAGSYAIAGMVPGEYSVVISHSGYRTSTLPTVDVIDGSTKNLNSVFMEINRGTISGVVTLEGKTNYEGIKVELLQGSVVFETQYTDNAGGYLFYVPQGNYSAVRITKTDFRSEIVSYSIALFADNYVAIDNKELQAIANTVNGTVDILTTDDESDVTISFDGHEEFAPFITEDNGHFCFEHIPLGNYILRFRRENCSDITMPISVIPSDRINVGIVTITPNTASITGKVNLANGTSLSGVLVSVDMGDNVATGYTDASGRYEIGGITVADTYTVTYSKAGWDSKNQQISPKLEKLEVRELDEITLIDTSAPVLNSVVINSGANTAADRNVTLHFTTIEQGSGVSKVMITYDNVFDRTVTRHDYLPNMEWALPSGNGEKTIYVKVIDASGNESNTATAKLTLTDQKKEVSGVLTGDDLHWTKELSPYLVTGNIMVEEDKTLIIDPGVDVQFAGSYYIQVEGVLSAVGTEQKPISFYGVGDGNENWQGIYATKDNGSEIKYSSITGLVKGLRGYLKVSHSSISSNNGYAVGFDSSVFSGVITASTIKGKVNTKNAQIIDCSLDVKKASIKGSSLKGNIICGDVVSIQGCLVENSLFSSLTVCSLNSGMVNSSLKYCDVGLTDGGLYYKCTFDGCSFSSFTPAIIRESNIVSCGLISIETDRLSFEVIDLCENFWGYDNTREIESNGINSNLSFVSDYYDDFNSTKALLDGFKTEYLPYAGYVGDEYYSETEESLVEYEIGDIGPAGGIVFYDKGFYSEGWRYLEVGPTDICSDTLEERLTFGFYRPSKASKQLRTGTGWSIGDGRINTQLLVITMENHAYSDLGQELEMFAAKICYEYSFNGYSDWFLPSIYELEQIMVSGIDCLRIGSYVSSSEDPDWRDRVWILNTSFNSVDYTYRGNDLDLRPVRAF